MDLVGLDEIGAKYIFDQKLSQLTSIMPNAAKEWIQKSEKRLAAVKELTKYDKK